jgi:hypothetical protein
MDLTKLYNESEEPVVRAILDPILPSLGVGSFTGASGLAVGLLTGSLRSAHPVLFAAVSGAQWFGLGTTFWYTRSALGNTAFDAQLNRKRVDGQLNRKQELGCTIIAASLAGGVNGAFKSRSNIIPGAIVLGLFGLVGQYGFNVLSDMSAANAGKGSLLQQFSEMKWSPLKPLSNQDYERMLNEKLLSTEAEIAIIDERISALKSSQEARPSTPVSKLG